MSAMRRPQTPQTMLVGHLGKSVRKQQQQMDWTAQAVQKVEGFVRVHGTKRFFWRWEKPEAIRWTVMCGSLHVTRSQDLRGSYL